MKTTKEKSFRAMASTPKKSGPAPKSKERKNIEDRDLNGEEGQTTNTVNDEDNDVRNEDTSPPTLESDTSVEDEQDREVKRRLEDAHPEELLK